MPESYDVIPVADWFNMGSPLEVESVMTYCSFCSAISTTTPVMTVKDTGATFSDGYRVTTTDAKQLQWMYCESDTINYPDFEYKETTSCSAGDMLGFTREVFTDRLCDSIVDCASGEDEDGSLAECEPKYEPTPRGCCGGFNVGYDAGKCVYNGESFNDYDVWDCDDGSAVIWSPFGKWLVMQPDKWPIVGGSYGWWSSFATSDPDCPPLGVTWQDTPIIPACIWDGVKDDGTGTTTTKADTTTTIAPTTTTPSVTTTTVETPTTTTPEDPTTTTPSDTTTTVEPPTTTTPEDPTTTTPSDSTTTVEQTTTTTPEDATTNDPSPPGECTQTLDDSVVTCDDALLKIEIPICALEEAGFMPTAIFMAAEGDCQGNLDDNGNLVFDTLSQNCTVDPVRMGDVLVFNSTIFTKEMGASNGIISRQFGIELDFSCVLETLQTVSLDEGITVNVNHFVVDLGEQLGSFNIEMAVYDAPEFNEPASADHVFSVPDQVYIAVKNDDSSLAVALENCIASSGSGTEYALIENACASDAETTILSSGVTPEARFQFESFQFSGSSDPISIECDITICDPTQENCNVCMATRKRRAAQMMTKKARVRTLIITN